MWPRQHKPSQTAAEQRRTCPRKNSHRSWITEVRVKKIREGVKLINRVGKVVSRTVAIYVCCFEKTRGCMNPPHGRRLTVSQYKSFSFVPLIPNVESLPLRIDEGSHFLITQPLKNYGPWIWLAQARILSAKFVADPNTEITITCHWPSQILSGPSYALKGPSSPFSHGIEMGYFQPGTGPPTYGFYYFIVLRWIWASPKK